MLFLLWDFEARNPRLHCSHRYIVLPKRKMAKADMLGEMARLRIDHNGYAVPQSHSRSAAHMVARCID